jgi:hypothetical protein
MRNLEILSKFTARCDDIESEDTVAAMSLDEYGHLLFVYTIGHHMYAYKYNNNNPGVDLQLLGHS